MSKGSDKRSVDRGLGVVPWLMVMGFAAAFLVGRRSGPFEGLAGGGEAGHGEHAAAAHADPEKPGAAYASEAEFPSKWIKAADLASVKGVNIAGLTDQQKAIAAQVLNENKCSCGCGMESLAFCAKNDKACPVSPGIAANAFNLARQGKSLADVRAAIARPAAAPAAPPAEVGKVTIPAHAPRKGPKAAKVTVVEFSDFQCPFCSRVVPAIKQITETYPKDVAVVFVNLPLSFHDRARPAARAFLAAARQGKGWEMHDKMFENQQALQDADLETYAKEIGLDVAKWKKDAASPEIEAQIKSDEALAGQVGATGTPASFVNGRKVSGAKPFAAFQTVIDEELKKADALLAQGVKLDALYDKLVEQNVASAPKAAAAAAPAAKVDVKIGDAPVKGPTNAPVTIVEFSDFQCPFCSRVVPTLKQIEETYKGKVKVAFRHYPLPFHDKAQLAAEASMAAHEQGKFWPMHDKLFENQQALDRVSLESYAQQLGLDMNKFRAALDSGKFRKVVEQDMAYGSTVGVSGTPAFFVNGKFISGAQPFAAFKTEIDAALAAPVAGK